MDSDGGGAGPGGAEGGVREVAIGGGTAEDQASRGEQSTAGASDAAEADDDRTWRCKACGALQRDPEPPCHRCWNSTFVAGRGADRVTGSSGTIAGVSTDPVSAADVADARVENVKAATARTAFAGVLGTGFFSVTTLLLPEGGLLHSLSATAEFGVGVVSVVLLAFTALVYAAALLPDWK